MDYINKLIGTGILLVIIGILVLFAGIIVSIVKSGSGKVEGGGIIFIGPIPIVFGTSQEVTKTLLVLAIILVILAAIVYLLLSRGIKPV